MGQRVTIGGEVNRKGSRSESESEQGEKSLVVDPKPGDLSMGRLKVA